MPPIYAFCGLVLAACSMFEGDVSYVRGRRSYEVLTSCEKIVRIRSCLDGNHLDSGGPVRLGHTVRTPSLLEEAVEPLV
jgi:hypothetical protein